MLRALLASVRATFRTRWDLAAGEPCPPPAARPLQPADTSPANLLNRQSLLVPALPGLARLARRPPHRQIRDGRRLAPVGLSSLLEMEIACDPRTPKKGGEPAVPPRRNSSRQPELGRAENPRRAASRPARHVASDGNWARENPSFRAHFPRQPSRTGRWHRLLHHLSPARTPFHLESLKFRPQAGQPRSHMHPLSMATASRSACLRKQTCCGRCRTVATPKSASQFADGNDVATRLAVALASTSARLHAQRWVRL